MPKCLLMPRYFFDVQDGALTSRDDEGSEFPNAERAHRAAVRALGELANDELEHGPDQRLFVMKVRDEQGHPTSELVLSLEAKRI